MIERRLAETSELETSGDPCMQSTCTKATATTESSVTDADRPPCPTAKSDDPEPDVTRPAPAGSSGFTRFAAIELIASSNAATPSGSPTRPPSRSASVA